MQAIEELNKAEGHLMKAMEQLGPVSPPASGYSAIYYAKWLTVCAGGFVRKALERLEKAELCKP